MTDLIASAAKHFGRTESKSWIASLLRSSQ
jgi:hypothetical protein